MKRLTKRNEEGIANFCGEYGNPPYPVVTQEILDKMADYEDLGFTPEEIDYMAKFFKEQTSAEVIADNMKTVAKLLEWSKWKDAEEEGKLVVLPVKVGDTVYEPRPDRGNLISVYTVVSVHVSACSVLVGWILEEGIYSKLNGFEVSALGKTVFLTRSEAEEALEKMKGEHNEQRNSFPR